MSDHDDGVIQVLLERLNQQRLPLLLEMKNRVDRGEKLNELDIVRLKEALTNANEITPLIARHPEYEGLAAQVIGLYKEITDQALKNEQNG